MAEAMELASSKSYFKNHNHEHPSQPYIAEEGRHTAPRLRIESETGSRFEAYLVALLRAMGSTFEVQDLAKQADVLIKELDIPPSEFVYKALVDFVERYEDEKLTRAYNEAYDGEMEEEEEEMLHDVTAYHRRRLNTT